MTPNLSAPETPARWGIFLLLLSTFFTGLFLYDGRDLVASVGTGVFGGVSLGIAIGLVVFAWRGIREPRS